MTEAWCILIGLLAGGPLWVLAALWAARRLWRNARRLAARARGREHLLEAGQLVGGLAHEIKNPLSTVNVNLKLLAEDLARHDDDEHRRLLARLRSVREEADRVKDILDDFLRYAGKIEVAPAETDLREVVEDLLDFYRPQAEAAKVVLRSALPEAPVRCRVDADLIKQALLNLVINATQAMPEGGEILVRVSANRQRAGLEIIDTGPGIPPEELPKIFQAYYSTKKGGSGLGLPTSRRIIRAHEGSIRVDSEPGRGTRFVIFLPLVRSPAPPAGAV